MPRTLRAVDAALDESAVARLVPALAAALDGTGPALLPVPAADPTRRQALAAALRPGDETVPLEHDNVALVVPTSGSTGAPKGALLTATALRHSASATLDRLGGPGSWLLAVPPTHIAGLQVLIRSLLAGRPVAVLESAGGFRAETFAAATARLRAAAPGDRLYTALVPTQVRRLLDAGSPGRDALAGYDAVLLGGAATPPSMLAEAAAAGSRLVTTYGMSETCGGCVYDGTPLAGVRWRLGANGRVELAGPVLARGYRLRPEESATAFTDGWFRTADLGRQADDGSLVVLGRADDVIVTGGEKVAALAVEDALVSHPGVTEAAVVGVADPEWGQRVVAVVVPADPASPPELAELRGYVAAAAGAAAAPREIVVVGSLPRLALGKVDRAAVRAIATAVDAGRIA